MPEIIQHWDTIFFLWLNRDFGNPVFDALFPFITNAKSWIIPAIIGVFFYVKAEKKKAIPVLILLILTAILTDQIAASVIKPLVRRLRPCNLHALVEGGRFLLGHNPNFSFPSNHAANMFGAATVLTLHYPRRWLWFYLFAGLIGFSRIYVGLHYPFDVAAGAALGIICGMAMVGIWRLVLRIMQRASPPPAR